MMADSSHWEGKTNARTTHAHSRVQQQTSTRCTYCAHSARRAIVIMRACRAAPPMSYAAVFVGTYTVPRPSPQRVSPYCVGIPHGLGNNAPHCHGLSRACMHAPRWRVCGCMVWCVWVHVCDSSTCYPDRSLVKECVAMQGRSEAGTQA